MASTIDINLTNLYESLVQGFSADQEVSKAIAEIQLSDAFFSKIIAGMSKYTSKGGTMSTDGKNLTYNPEFVKKLVQYGGNNSVQGVIVHEILHIAFGHHLAFAKELDEAVKKNDENLKSLVNIACDLAINDFLKGRPGFPQDLYIPGVNPNEEPFKSFPPNKDARWYFNQLVDFYKNNKPQDSGKSDDQKPQDDQKSDDGGDEGQQGGGDAPQGEEQAEGEGAEGGGEGTPQEGSGDEEGEADGEPSEGKGEEGGTGGGEGEGKQGKPQPSGSPQSDQGGQSGAGGQAADDQKINDLPQDLIEKYKQTGEISAPSDMTPDEAVNNQQQHEQDMKEYERDARKIDEIKERKGIGRHGGAYSGINYRNFIKDQSRIPWNQIINEFLSKSENSRQSYRRPSRRMAGLNFDDFYHGGSKEIIMPSRQEKKLNELIFIVDVSGSNEQAANAVFPELVAAINSSGFGQQSSLRLVSFNANIEDEYVFSFNPSNDYMSLKFPNRKVPQEKIIVPDGNELIKAEDAHRFNWRVGGGTRFLPVLKALDNLPEQPPFIVVLTDGEFFGEEVELLQKGLFKFKIIWVMTRDNGIRYQGYRTYNLYDMDY